MEPLIMNTQHQWMKILRRQSTRLIAVAGTVILLWIAFVSSVPIALAAAGDWPTYLFNNARTGFNSAETTITRANVANLKVHWTFQASGNLNAITAQPV